jgi:hypothetical protein
VDVLTTLFWGFVGGAAPEVVRVCRIVKEDNSFSYSKSMFIASCLMAILGALLAYALQVMTPYQAIYVGISTPVIISKMMENPATERWQKREDQ